MRVELRPVAAGDPREVTFDLPHREEFLKLLRSAALEHPLDGGELARASNGMPVTVEVVVSDGLTRDYSSMATNAEIYCDPVLAERTQPVEIVFHLRCYLGENPLDRSRTIPCKPAARLVRDTPFDSRGLRRTLLHELTHLADALDREFEYSPEKKLSLPRVRRAVLMDLWNGYIDRRLRDSVQWPEELRPAMKRTSRRLAVNEALSRVWKGDRFSHDELISLAVTAKLT